MSVLVSCLSPVVPGWKGPQEPTRRPCRCPALLARSPGTAPSWQQRWLLSFAAVGEGVGENCVQIVFAS